MKKYEIYEFQYHTKGYLQGYAIGDIEFQYNDTEYRHEFLYRFLDDPNNGKGNTIVSIDYGFEIPYIKEVWADIRSELKSLCEKKISE